MAGELEYDQRPWGNYQVLADEADHKIKRITVHVGQRLSYQRHQFRQEHWVVTAGTATVTIEGLDHVRGPGESIDIPTGAAHRIANYGDEDLVFVEVQLGTYFGEDDIERLEDDYGR